MANEYSFKIDESGMFQIQVYSGDGWTDVIGAKYSVFELAETEAKRYAVEEGGIYKNTSS
jgi:hypothetical protein